MVHEPESASAQLPRLRDPSGTGRRPPFKAVCLAHRHTSGLLEESAGHVQGCLDHQVAALVVQAMKIHDLRVTQEPRRLVVKGVVTLVQLADPQGDRQSPALGAEAAAGWSWSQSGIRKWGISDGELYPGCRRRGLLA